MATTAGSLPSPDPDPDPVSGISWQRNLAAIWTVQLLAIIGFSLRVPFLPFYLADLGVDTVQGQTLWSGMINAVGAGVMAISAPLWGIYADRHGRRLMLIRAAFGGMLTVGLMGLATAPWQLLGLRMLEGALTGTVTAATVLVATTTPKQRIGFALGGFAGPLIGATIAAAFGVRVSFIVVGVMLLMLSAAVMRRIPPSAD
ncbi:MAG: MFS transporter, partial [Chloroflexota bacterium]